MTIIDKIKSIFTPRTDLKNLPDILREFKKPVRHVDKVFLHCSASDHPNHDDISVIRKWHVEGNHWSDVGYHYFIKKDGTIQKGRPLEKIPSAQYPYNNGTIAICLSGLEARKFTPEQFAALKMLCNVIYDAYRGKVTYHGHREVSNKSCPVFDYRRVLNLDLQGHLLA